jgi:hypothetical protein
MKKIARFAGLAGIVALFLTVTGCTTEAGPYVTDISSDGKGNIVVTKNTVVVDGFTGCVTSGQHPTQEVIRVVPTPAQP